MTKVFSKALNKTIEVNRFIGKIKGTQSGPTIIFTAGMHGNEPSGIFALHDTLNEIKEKNIPIKGNIYAISGNLTALEKGTRYIKQDLNRMWTPERMELITSGNIEKNNEETIQQLNIYNVISKIIATEEGPFYFMDLHTTSSETTPFLTVNDSIINRKFTEQYPVPLILGIEEYLDGPLLSYLNELGYVAFGFEGGQHDSLSSIENHKSFIYQSLVFTESVEKSEIDFQYYYNSLAKTSVNTRNIYEIYYHYRIKEDESFKMKPGFLNFQKINKGEELAKSNGEVIVAKQQGRILMPQYQSQGDDGYFSIRKIPSIFLNLSTYFRTIRIDRLLPIMPGVSWSSDQQDSLIVNRKIAWLFAKQFFHLLGYRSKKFDKNYLIIKNREAVSKREDYKEVLWAKS